MKNLNSGIDLYQHRGQLWFRSVISSLNEYLFLFMVLFSDFFYLIILTNLLPFQDFPVFSKFTDFSSYHLNTNYMFQFGFIQTKSCMQLWIEAVKYRSLQWHVLVNSYLFMIPICIGDFFSRPFSTERKFFTGRKKINETLFHIHKLVKFQTET